MLTSKQTELPGLTIKELLIEGVYIDVSLDEEKCLICCSFNPNKIIISKHLYMLDVV